MSHQNFVPVLPDNAPFTPDMGGKAATSDLGKAIAGAV